MAARIHETAIVAAGAQIADGAEVGPYCVIGGDVAIGEGACLLAHVSVEGRTEIGAGARVHPFAVLGGPPQHVGYRGEKTALKIGADCVIREHANIHLGTVHGGGQTTIADGVVIMTGVHVGHDCSIGPRATLASGVSLGGHSVIEADVFIGGLAGLHQYTRIGAHAYIGGCAAVAADVIPYGIALGNRARLGGLNIIGLKRNGVPRETIRDMRAVYRLLFEEEGAARERVEAARARYGRVREAARILDFVDAANGRPLMAPRD